MLTMEEIGPSFYRGIFPKKQRKISYKCIQMKVSFMLYRIPNIKMNFWQDVTKLTNSNTMFYFCGEGEGFIKKSQ